MTHAQKNNNKLSKKVRKILVHKKTAVLIRNNNAGHIYRVYKKRCRTYYDKFKEGISDMLIQQLINFIYSNKK